MSRLKRKIDEIENEEGIKYRFRYIAGVTVAPNDDIIVADNHILAFTPDGQFKVSYLLLLILS